MSISIAYSGRLNNPQDWAIVTDEMKLWADRVGWEWVEFDRHILGQTTGVYSCDDESSPNFPLYKEARTVDERWRGIRMQPTDLVESFYVAFNRAGQLVSYWDLKPSEDGTANYMHIEHPWVKSYRSQESHIEICKILRYLKEQYIADLEVEDDAEYYDTMDSSVFEEAQERMFGLVAGLMALSADTGMEVKTSTELPPPPNPDLGKSIHEN